MGERANEPKTFEDLWFMCKTSNAWFDGQIRYENVREKADPRGGGRDRL